MLYLQRTSDGVFTSTGSSGPWSRRVAVVWDELLASDDPESYLAALPAAEPVASDSAPGLARSLVDSQEVWAAGVTYYRSRNARMAESEEAGGGSFYDKVYAAERPELFFKGNRRTTVASGEPVRIRSDSEWNVPEPELVLVINAKGAIVGYTSGNDMSSRDIEGANPLYLPQAKVYDGSCALGPTIAFTRTIDRSMGISVSITRGGTRVFEGETDLGELKREPGELAEFLCRHQSFSAGAYLMTGTGIIPDDSFTLQAGDEVTITVGTLAPLTNVVA